MSLTKSLHPDEKYKAGKLGSTMMKAGVGIAVVMMIVSLVLGSMHGDGMKRFLYAYVVGWSFIVSIAIGMLWLVLLHHLTRSRWSTVVRRIAEAITGAFPMIFIAGLGFTLPVLFGNKNLYYWSADDAHNALLNPTLAHKLGWLSPGSWFVRYCIYGAIYIGPLLVLREEVARAGRVRRSEDQRHAAPRLGPGDDPVLVHDLLDVDGHPDVARAEVVLDDLRRRRSGARPASAASRRSA